MAFKMKGSAFKLGNVATKSALKQGKSPLEDAKHRKLYNEDGSERDPHPHPGVKDVQLADGNFANQPGTWTDGNTFVPEKHIPDQEDYNVQDEESGVWRKEEMEGGPQMKSPMKDTKADATEELHHKGMVAHRDDDTHIGEDPGMKQAKLAKEKNPKKSTKDIAALAAAKALAEGTTEAAVRKGAKISGTLPMKSPAKQADLSFSAEKTKRYKKAAKGAAKKYAKEAAKVIGMGPIGYTGKKLYDYLKSKKEGKGVVKKIKQLKGVRPKIAKVIKPT